MTRRVLAIIVALAVALFGAVGAVVYAQAADSRAIAGQQTVTVYIAAAEVPTGTSAADALSRRLIAPQQVVTKGVPAGALTSIDASTAKLVATSPISAGEVVLSSRFGTIKQTPAQTSIVPDGQVAITVSLADPQRIAPLLVPGSHIVIYDTFNPRNEKAQPLTPDGGHLRDNIPGIRVTRVVLADIQVIAVGSAKLAPTASPPPGDGAQPNADQGSSALVTVAVTPAQSLTLVHAVQTGTLYAGLLGKGSRVDPKAFVTDDTILSK